MKMKTPQKVAGLGLITIIALTAFMTFYPQAAEPDIDVYVWNLSGDWEQYTLTSSTAYFICNKTQKNCPAINQTSSIIEHITYNGNDTIEPTNAKYEIEAGSGTVLIDSISVNNGTINGSDWVPGIAKNSTYALKFMNNNSDYVNFSVNDEHKLTGPMTITFWINVSSCAYLVDKHAGVICRGGYDLNEGYEVLISASCSLEWTLKQSSVTCPLELNKIYYVALTNNGSFSQIYIDGVLNTTANTTATTNSTVPLTLGYRSVGNSFADYFNGTLDNVKMYSRVLSASEIFNGAILENYSSNPQSIFNITNNGTATGNVVMRVNETAPRGYTLFCSNSTNSSKTITLNTTWKEFYGQLAENESCNAWCWMNYTKPDKSWWYEFEFNITA